MDPQFWIESWEQGGFKTSFHRPDVHPYILEHMTPDLLAGQTVLVPLCGKSVDLLYFAQHAKAVIGVELSDEAVAQFFAENDLTPKQRGDIFEHQNLRIYNRDLFSVGRADMPEISMLYDRASLIAFPPQMRSDYVAHVKTLLPIGAVQYINTLEYAPDQGQPPFNVPPSEVRAYYEDMFEITHLEQQDRATHGLIRVWGLDYVTEHFFRAQRLR